MKITKQIVAVAILGAFALSAQATGWNITGPSPVVTTGGVSGEATYIFTPNSSGTLSPANNVFTWTSLPLPGGPSPIASYVVLSGDSGSYTAGTPFDVTVEWTTISVPPGNYAGFENFFLGTSDGYQSTSQDFTVVVTPEPAQTVAGAMLLGCGGLAFAGRRLFKKQVA